MSLSTTVMAMVAAGCSPEQIGAVVVAYEAEADLVLRSRRLKVTEKKRRQRALKAELSPVVPGTDGDMPGQQGTIGDTSPPSPPPAPPASLPPMRDINSTPFSPPLSPPATSPTPNAIAMREASAAAFGRFWAAWPHKVGKPAALRAFGKHAGAIDEILAGVDRSVRDKPPDRPWLNPSTFLNQERWNDQPAPEPVFDLMRDHRDAQRRPSVQDAARELQALVEAGGDGAFVLGQRPQTLRDAMRDAERAKSARLLSQG